MTRILVIDDDPRVAYSIQTLLEYEGYEVVVAENGLTGIRAIERDPFDAVKAGHSYATPAIMVLPIESMDAAYLAWIIGETASRDDS